MHTLYEGYFILEAYLTLCVALRIRDGFPPINDHAKETHACRLQGTVEYILVLAKYCYLR